MSELRTTPIWHEVNVPPVDLMLACENLPNKERRRLLEWLLCTAHEDFPSKDFSAWLVKFIEDNDLK
jgi:hypothetical protein